MIWSYKELVPNYDDAVRSPDQCATGFYDYAPAGMYSASQPLQRNQMFVLQTNACMLQDPGLSEPTQSL